MQRLSETAILARTGSSGFVHGQGYWQSGAILSLAKRGQSLYAEVEGRDYEPCRVAIHWSEGGDVEADCSCPRQEWGSWCLHIVAVLLAYAHDEDEIEEQPPIEELLEPFTREQLVELLVELSQRNPALYDEVVAVVTGEEPDEDEEDW